MYLLLLIKSGFHVVLSKVNGFALTTLYDWLKISRHFSIQSEVKLKPIVTRSHTDSRPSREPRVITSTFDSFSIKCISKQPVHYWIVCAFL